MENEEYDYSSEQYEDTYGDNYDFGNDDYQMDGGAEYDYIDNQNEYEGNNEEYDMNFGDASNNYDAISDKKPYQVLPFNALLGELAKCLQTAREMTALPDGWCLLLLRQFKWDIDFMAEYFQNVAKYQAKVGFSQEYSDPKNLTVKTGTCEVCCAEQIQICTNICQHGFCIDCWGGHLSTAINSGSPFPKCMGCECPVLYETILSMLQLYQPNSRKLTDRYQKKLCELFSSIHRNFEFCTGADCNNCIKVYDLNIQTVRCTCGKAFCFKCKDDDHSPCTCEEKKKWMDFVMKEEADAKWMSVNTKLCPWCKKAVERSAGCNYMACLCGKSFCYLCSRPWQPDHKDHFKCHIYKKTTTEVVSREKEILQKMNFYTERFLDNQASANENKKIDMFSKRKYLFKVLGIDLSDSEFMQAACKFAIECCETLKWIYTYSYYVKWKDENEKANFEFFQGEFEKHKANLLKMIAVDLKKFMSKVEALNDHCEEPLMPQNLKQECLTEFKGLKTNIVNYYTMTKTYKEKFISEIETKECHIDEPLLKKKSSDRKPKAETKGQTGARPKGTQEKTSMAGKFMKYFTNN